MGRSIVGQYGQAASAPQFKSNADPRRRPLHDALGRGANNDFAAETIV
jgi:hypothetical protein